MDIARGHVLVCGGTGCTSSGSENIIKEMEEQLRKNGLEKEIKVVKTGCFGLCALGPIMIVYPEGAFYSRVQDVYKRQVFIIMQRGRDKSHRKLVREKERLV